MTVWPHVLSEMATLDRVLAGASLARYGDGEFKCAKGGSIKSQDAHPVLARRLREILHDSGDCLIGIPNLHSATPKAEYWQQQADRHSDLLADRAYVSAFVSRPDSAPWINTAEYWDKVAQLWRGRPVTLVRGSGKAFTPELMTGHGGITEILAPKHSAWTEYDVLLARIGTPDRVLLSLGPTATVMAVDLCRQGVHAIDTGHMGAFRRRWLGEEGQAAA